MPDTSSAGLPVVLIPGLNCSARLYAEQIPVLWRFGPVTVADHRRDDTMAAIARRILAAAPPRFALAGLSMGGYIAFEIMRQAPQRVAKLALLDTGAREARRCFGEDAPRNRRHGVVAPMVRDRDRTEPPQHRNLLGVKPRRTIQAGDQDDRQAGRRRIGHRRLLFRFQKK